MRCAPPSSHVYDFFNNYLFFKFINKCQKEIMRCAPPSSHVCDFFNNYLFFKFINKCWKEIVRWSSPSSHVCDFLLYQALVTWCRLKSSIEGPTSLIIRLSKCFCPQSVFILFMCKKKLKIKFSSILEFTSFTGSCSSCWKVILKWQIGLST